MNTPNNSLRKFFGLFIVIVTSTFSVQAQNWIQLGNDMDGEAEDDYSGYNVSANSSGDVVAAGPCLMTMVVEMQDMFESLNGMEAPGYRGERILMEKPQRTIPEGVLALTALET